MTWTLHIFTLLTLQFYTTTFKFRFILMFGCFVASKIKLINTQITCNVAAIPKKWYYIYYSSYLRLLVLYLFFKIIYSTLYLLFKLTCTMFIIKNNLHLYIWTNNLHFIYHFKQFAFYLSFQITCSITFLQNNLY